jgi:hypothetical protein
MTDATILIDSHGDKMKELMQRFLDRSNMNSERVIYLDIRADRCFTFDPFARKTTDDGFIDGAGI